MLVSRRVVLFSVAFALSFREVCLKTRRFGREGLGTRPSSFSKICASQIGNHFPMRGVQNERCFEVSPFHKIMAKKWKKYHRSSKHTNRESPVMGLMWCFPSEFLYHPDYLNLRINSWQFCWWPFQDGENVTFRRFIEVTSNDQGSFVGSRLVSPGWSFFASHPLAL